VQSEASRQLPLLSKNCSTSLILSKVLPSLKLSLATESNQHVKGAMAHSVWAMAKNQSKQEATQHLIPMINILLKKNSTDVIVCLRENMEGIVSQVSQTAIDEKIIPDIISLDADKAGRVKLVTI
jgi:hypothetical protein